MSFSIEERARMLEGVLDLKGVVTLSPEPPADVDPEARDVMFAAVTLLSRRRPVEQFEEPDGTIRLVWAGSAN